LARSGVAGGGCAGDDRRRRNGPDFEARKFEGRRRMKWVAVAIGVCVLLAALMALAGAMLPRAHHATRKARYRQAPAAVYGVLIGPPDWRRDLKAWGPLPENNGRAQWWEQDSHGHKVIYELVESNPPTRRVIRIASP